VRRSHWSKKKKSVEIQGYWNKSAVRRSSKAVAWDPVQVLCVLDEWTQGILEKNEVYFQSPDCFNDPFDSTIAYTYEGTEEKPAPNMYTESLRRKADVWEYEQEWRIIDPMNGPGIQRFPPEALTSVYLGCRITSENRIKITNWCRARDPRPKVYWAEEKTREFGLDFKRIERE
jgi:hypothetical protein